MQVFENIKDIREFSRFSHKNDREIGFVPTMGFLHRGHMSLIDRAKEENDCVVVSIFVNPTQFMPGEDFDKYPRDMDSDLAKCEETGVDVVFIPQKEDMYPEGSQTSVHVNALSNHMCGISRGVGHFTGVCTIVTKLFNIVSPDNAYFGQKDIQQALILSRMVEDLNFGINIEICPTVREEDGLAMSSRNNYLKGNKRKEALCLYNGLCAGRNIIKEGEKTSMLVSERIMEKIGEIKGAEIDYIEIVDPKDLCEAAWIDNTVIIAGAVKLDGVRLIDNLIVNPEDGPWEDIY